MAPHSPEEPAAPAFAEIDPSAGDSRWPRVIGVISLIYGIGGLLCAVGVGFSTMLSEWLMSLGGMKVEVPVVMKTVAVVSSLLALILGIIMVSAATGLLRRRRGGVTWLKRWAILRLGLLLAGVVVNVLTVSSQIQMQREILEAQNKMFRENNMESRIVEIDEHSLWRKIMLQSSIFTGLLAVYPVFLGLYLSRRRVVEEIQEWD